MFREVEEHSRDRLTFPIRSTIRTPGQRHSRTLGARLLAPTASGTPGTLAVGAKNWLVELVNGVDAVDLENGRGGGPRVKTFMIAVNKVT